MSRPSGSAAIALLLAAGCSEPGGAPTLLARYDPANFDTVPLFWTHPRGAAGDGYAVEGRAVPAPFEVLGRMSVSQPSMVYGFARDAPEATTFEFRVRALPDDDGSRASNVVSIRRGLRPPVLSCTADALGCAPLDGTFRLQWTNPSRVADAFSVERRVQEPGRFIFDSTSGWSAVAAVAAGTGFSDADLATWTDGAGFEYRVIAMKGPDRSVPSNMRGTRRALLTAPTPVTATALPDGGARISFRNASRAAHSVRVTRTVARPGPGFPFVIARMDAPAPLTTTIDDPFAPPGVIDYAVEAVFGDSFSTSVVDSPTNISIVLPPKDFSAAYVTVPPGTAAVRTAAGAFATAGGLQPAPGGAPFLVAPDGGTGAARSLPSSASLFRPGVVLDAAGHPHAVHAEAVTGPPPSVAIVHTWHDGQSWQTEEIARTEPVQRVRFDIGIDGTMHASWSSPTSLEVASLVGGTWTVENVAAALGADFQPDWANHFLAGDGTGGAQMVVIASASGDRVLRVFRDATGWHTEPIPTAGIGAFPAGEDGVRVIAQAGAPAIAYQPPGAFDVFLLDRISAGWRWRILTFALERFRATTLEAGRSADGSRIAVTAEAANGSARLWVIEGDVTSTKTWFDVGSRHAVGFRADGKAWILGGLQDDASPASPVRALLTEEL
jgi:hypothetical protein